MIRKSGYRFSEKIMLKREARARWRFNLIPSRSSRGFSRGFRCGSLSCRFRRSDQTERNCAGQAVDDVPMLDQLAVGHAEKIRRRKPKLVVGRGPPLIRAILCARPLHARDHLVALCDDLLNLGMIIAERREKRGGELLPAGESRRQVLVVLDEVRDEIAVDRG